MKNRMEIKETGSHYTSWELSKFMARKLLEQVELNNSSGDYKTILDPACGEGELLRAFYHESKDPNLQLIGIDTNKNAIEIASQKLNSKNNENVHLFNRDYLNLFDNEINLFSEPLTKADYWNYNLEEDGFKKVDMIIANPPYVRTQVLGGEKAQDLGKRFNLKGRVDLYQVFLVAMTQHLRENGLICVITSNRYLTTAGAKDLRGFLDNNYEIIEIIDLGDTKLFDAAVLPAIFIGKKKKNNSLTNKNHNVKFYRIYENNELNNTKKIGSLFDLLLKRESGDFEINNKKYEVTEGFLKIPDNPEDVWIMASEEDIKWSETVKSRAICKFGDIFNIRVGIKSTADNVFIRDDWDSLRDEIRPEEELLKPLVTSKTTRKWSLSKLDNRKILYTHEIKDGKRQAINLNSYPGAKAYLEIYKEQLEGRSYVLKANRNWYEIWVPHDPNKWALPKVVFPDISPEPKFALDTNGYLVDGNCYWLLPKNEKHLDLLYLAVAIANSAFMSKFHDIEFQNKLYAGRRRYLTQYIKNYPLPDPSSKHSKRLIEISKILTHNILSEDEIKSYESEIDKEVNLAFGFKNESVL